MKYKDDSYTLSTGKEINANCGILGINKDDGIIRIYDGFDGRAYGHEKLNKQERRELADYVIALWNQWVESSEK